LDLSDLDGFIAKMATLQVKRSKRAVAKTLNPIRALWMMEQQVMPSLSETLGV
jgi:hypothetical protein